jgi:hypothetical protein
MAASGTYAWSPEVSEICDEAFERCGIDPATLTGRHMRSARLSMNYLFSHWATRGVMLWAIDRQKIDCVAGTAAYSLATGTQAILDATLLRDGTETPVSPIARDEYVNLPDKTQRGMPSSYYLDRQLSPQVYLWPTPDASTDDFYYYRLRRLQDVGNASNTPDIPHYWQEALASGLAAKLAEKYAPEREAALLQKAEMAFSLAHQEDRQRTPTVLKVSRGRVR